MWAADTTVRLMMMAVGADPTKCVDVEGLDPYRWLMHSCLRFSGVPARITPEWLALVSELGVSIDTESPLPPPGDHGHDAPPDATDRPDGDDDCDADGQ
jgi:hypothetical protein